MVGKNFSLCGGLELPVADRNAQGQQTWMQMNRSTVSELVPRTLKARLDVFAVLFNLIVGWFGLPVDRCQACKPHLGILKKMDENGWFQNSLAQRCRATCQRALSRLNAIT